MKNRENLTIMQGYKKRKDHIQLHSITLITLSGIALLKISPFTMTTE